MNKVRRAESRDAERILELLVQVNMVHHTGRPDIFKGSATKYTGEQLLGIFHCDKEQEHPFAGPEQKEC